MSINKANFQQTVAVSVERSRPLNNEFKPKGLFKIEHYRSGDLLNTYEFPNGVTTVGKNHALDVVFGGTTQVATWNIGFINASGFTAVAASDTMASHSGWTEFTNYTSATRVAWDEAAAAASGSLVSNSTSDFTINSAGTLKGVFINSVNTKSGTTGTLWSTALFAADVTVANTDVLKISYSVSLT